MELLSFWELRLIIFSLLGIAISFAASLVRSFLQPQKANGPSLHSVTSKKVEGGLALAPTRSIKKRLEQTGKRCVVFYGTQTGTAEKLALVMAKELDVQYNLPSMTADLDDFDHIDLTSMGPEQLVIFILATYGEGEPTDNAISFSNFLSLQRKQAGDSSVKSMSSLKYAAFGLGSSSYQFFNGMINRVDQSLRACGARRIGLVGLGDDGKGTLESDFVEWKESTLDILASTFSLEKLEYVFKPVFAVQEGSRRISTDVFLGEPNKNHLRNRISGPFTAQNPYPAKISETRDLFAAGDRKCLHLEFDISASTLTYETGDHLAVWPVNSDLEVARFLEVLGLREEQHQIISITSDDPTIKIPIPSTTTYSTAARYYLDICAPVSPNSLAILSTLTSGSVQKALQRLANDSKLFGNEVTAKLLNFAQILELISTTSSLSAVPFSFFLENVPKLQPRYYSISSSSLVSARKISVTAVVNSSIIPGGTVPFKGVSTNFLRAMKQEVQEQMSVTKAKQALQTHQVRGPRDVYSQPTVLIHVRRSKFRLPRDPATPIIMIGPGTGVAPFRAFVQERALRARAGRQVGRTILFYGCRRSDEDFLYKDEWETSLSSFKEKTLSIYTAFSRQDPAKKEYVQDLIRSRGDELKQLILDHNAHVYVCGEASRMAKDVFRTISEIIDDSVDGSGDAYLRTLKAKGRWSEYVW